MRDKPIRECEVSRERDDGVERDCFCLYRLDTIATENFFFVNSYRASLNREVCCLIVIGNLKKGFFGSVRTKNAPLCLREFCDLIVCLVFSTYMRR